MDELYDIVTLRVKKAKELNELLICSDDKISFIQYSTMGQASRSKILANMLRKAKEDEKYRIEKENWILNILKGIKDLNPEQKNSIFQRSFDIMKLLFPQYEHNFYNQNLSFHDTSVDFLNILKNLYESFFKPFEKTYEFKSQLKLIVRPQNQFVVYEMIKYLIEFTRDYFTSFIIFWQNARNKEQQNNQSIQIIHSNKNQYYNQQQPSQQSQIINNLSISNKQNNLIKTQNNINNNNHQSINQIKIQKPQSFTMTVETQAKLNNQNVQKYQSQNNRINILNPSTNGSSSSTSNDSIIQKNTLTLPSDYKLQLRKSQQDNIQITPFTISKLENDSQDSNTNNDNISNNNSSQNKLNEIDNIEKYPIKNDSFDTDKIKQSQNYQNINQNPISYEITDKFQQNLKDDNSSSQSEKEIDRKDNLCINEEDTVEDQNITFNIPTASISKDNSPKYFKDTFSETSYPILSFQKSLSIHMYQKKQTSIKSTLKPIQQYKPQEPKRAIDTIKFINPCLSNQWFQKKEMRVQDFKSIFISTSQLSDVMPDIDTSSINLVQYKLRKLKDLNSNDQKQQYDDLQLWMRNLFDTSYSRNTRISNSVQGYLIQLEDNYKNNFNFRSKLGSFYKQEVIRNNVSTHETSSLIIKMQQNRYNHNVLKKMKQNKTEMNFFSPTKFKSESNLENNTLSPLSKQSKSKRQSILKNFDNENNNVNNNNNNNFSIKLQLQQNQNSVNSETKQTNNSQEDTNQQIKDDNNNVQIKINNIIVNQNNKLEQNIVLNEENKKNYNQINLKNDNQLNSTSNQINKKRYHSLPKMRLLKEALQQEYASIHGQNEQFNKQNDLNNQQLQQNQNNLIKQQHFKKRNSSSSQQKLQNNNNEYGMEFKTKIIKLQTNQQKNAFLQPDQLFSMQSIQNIDEELNEVGQDILEEQDQTGRSSSLQLNHNDKNIRVIKIKSLHNNNNNNDQNQDRNNFNNESIIKNQNMNLNQNVKQNIQQNNILQSQFTQKQLSKSMSKINYSSKMQQNNNLLYRMTKQKQNSSSKTQYPSIHNDIHQRQSSVDQNNLITDLSALNKQESSYSYTDFQNKTNRNTPASNSNLSNNQGNFSSSIKNLERNNNYNPESPIHIRYLSNDKSFLDFQQSSEKKSSKCNTPLQIDKQNGQKLNNKIDKPLFSEKFKLIIQKTQHQMTPRELEQQQFKSEQKILQDQNIDEQNKIQSASKITGRQQYDRLKTKRSESVAAIKYIAENKDDNQQNQFYVQSQYNNLENNYQSNLKLRGSDIIIGNKNQQNDSADINSNSFNQSGQDQNSQSYQKDFFKLLQSSCQQVYPNLKQKTSSDFFKQIYAKVQLNRRLLQSSQIRRQNNNQLYFENYFQTNKVPLSQQQLSSDDKEEQIDEKNKQNLIEQQQIQQKQQQKYENLYNLKLQQQQQQQLQLQNQSQSQQQIYQRDRNSPNRIRQDMLMHRQDKSKESKQNKYKDQVKSREQSSEKKNSQQFKLKLTDIRQLVVKGQNQLILNIDSTNSKK